MGYVETTLGPDERILARAEFHWTYTLAAVLWIFTVIGILVFIAMMITKKTTEIVLTNKRVIHKHGWIARKTTEIGVQRAESVQVDQSVLGRIFGYGSLDISGVGVGHIHLPNIDDPLKFRKAILEAAQA